MMKKKYLDDDMIDAIKRTYWQVFNEGKKIEKKMSISTEYGGYLILDLIKKKTDEMITKLSEELPLSKAEQTEFKNEIYEVISIEDKKRRCMN